MSKHYVGEVGTDILLDTGIDLSDITSQYIKYMKPDGTTTGSFSGVLYSSYSLAAKAIGTYFVKHTLTASELNISGKWKFQAFIANSTGTWYGETAEENIYDSFE